MLNELLFLSQRYSGQYYYILISILHKRIYSSTVWNTHRIRTQESTGLPSGVSNYVFDFPSEYGLEKCGNNYI